MALVPRFALPLRYVNGSAVVNEQDSMDDIATCVEAVCLTNPGDRDDLPDFGLIDQTFSQQPLPLPAVLAQISAWEPRAQLLADQAPGQFDTSLVNANVYVQVSS